jgi:hypothetical protein
MIRSIRLELLRFPKRKDIPAVLAGKHIHDGSGNHDHEKGNYEEDFQSHDANMLRHFFKQRKLKFEQ